MTHIMLDLETWGRTPDCDIRSIGAVVFDPVAGTLVGYDATASIGHRVTSLEGKFYIATDNPIKAMLGEYVHARKYPLTRDPETVKWWSEQSPEAQAAFANPVDLRDALMQFAVWLESLSLEKPVNRYPDAVCSDIKIWSNGPQFDVSILDAAYRAVQLPTPWHYRAPRDFRTITEAAGMTHDDMRAFDTGTAHNALDDAISQARIVCEAYRRLGLQRS